MREVHFIPSASKKPDFGGRGKDKMKNYYIELDDLPRRLTWPAPLSGLCFHEDAIGTYDGIRPDNIEFAIRMKSDDQLAVDIQNGILTEIHFPHVMIKLPKSSFTTNRFSPRRAVSLIYASRHLDIFLNDGIIRAPYCWELGDLQFTEFLLKKMNSLVSKVYLPGIVDQLDALAWSMLHEIVVMCKLPRGDHDSPRLKIQHIASFFRQHYSEKIELDKLLRKYGLSQRTFYRYWSEQFQQTPKQFQLMLRIQEAQHLLSFSDSVQEIANRVGFTDVSAFFNICVIYLHTL